MQSGFVAEIKLIISWLASGVDCAAGVVIGLACLEALFKSALIFLHPTSPATEKTQVRLVLGRWLAVALELELGADILNTAVTPTWTEIGKLAAIATLRTSLNYFLEREIDAESRPSQRRAENKVEGHSSSPVAGI
jgi:uncharacterized membrane protein